MSIKWFVLSLSTILFTIATAQQDFRRGRNRTTIRKKLLLDAEDQQLEDEWINFKIQFNKSYPTSEIDYLRKNNFLSNTQFISDFNREYGSGLRGFVLKINSFGDLLVSDFSQQLNGYRVETEYDPSFPASAYIEPLNVNLPTRMDWRERGAVTPVKSQEKCASCHTFSAVGAVEGHTYRKTGNLVDLSEQNLLDCLRGSGYKSFGCEGGGHVIEDLKYIKENPGIDREDAYRYEAVERNCRFYEDAIGAYITGYVGIPAGNESALEHIVATLGPVSVGIDANLRSFQFYSGGVYYDENCRNEPQHIKHAMLVVGYGTDPDGKKYWLVKNSYGVQWGIGGYVKIAKDRNNHCGIATSAVYPLV